MPRIGGRGCQASGSQEADIGATPQVPTSPAPAAPPVTPAAPPAATAGRSARAVLRAAGKVREIAVAVLAAPESARVRVVQEHDALRAKLVAAQLAATPVERLRDFYGPKFPLAALQKAGFQTVPRVLDEPVEQLALVEGLDEEAARRLHEAAAEVRTVTEANVRVRIEPGAKSPAQDLVAALHAYDRIRRAVSPVAPAAEAVQESLDGLIPAARSARGRLRMLFAGKKKKAEALDALERLTATLERPQNAVIERSLRQTMAELASAPRPKPKELWRDFDKRSAAYYSALDAALGATSSAATAAGREVALPPEVIGAVQGQELDTTLLNATLRGYQHFGARYALAQRTVVIGDEMGLGKTVQSIAAMAHLTATGHTHFFVVCPASVMANWEREIAKLSALTTHRVHGNGTRDGALETWSVEGGVAITTFDTLRTLAVPKTPISMLVVDEAHYIKNPGTVRTKNVLALIRQSGRVILLSGTPLENRVAEFTNLVGYLRPDLVGALEASDEHDDEKAFRKLLAPAYLRRNQRDVLTELPELVEVDEWVEFSNADRNAYRGAVEDGHIMRMRRAAYASAKDSAKLRRLVEIVDESRDNGLKVLVFSYFRDVLDTVEKALGDRVVGHITGNTPAADRQGLVDSFSDVEGHAVLLSQIDAGGTGLNVQAASVIVLCEPQFKPSTEDQAVARAHRMGQNRVVRVYRLLAKESVDDALLARLGMKARLFDRYARRSVVAEATDDAVNTGTAVSDTTLARDLVAVERRRLSV